MSHAGQTSFVLLISERKPFAHELELLIALPHQLMPRFRIIGAAQVSSHAGNKPNRSADDPHDNVRATPSARVQKSEFLRVGGRVVDVCGGRPCHAVP